MTDDQRKLTHLRENVEHLQDKSNSLEGLLHTIQHTNEEEASEVFRRLRSGQDVQDIADHVQASHVLSGVGVQGRQRQGKRSSGRKSSSLMSRGRGRLFHGRCQYSCPAGAVQILVRYHPCRVHSWGVINVGVACRPG